MAQDKFRRVLAAGEVLFKEGDPGSEAYVVESGALVVYTQRPEGRTVLASLGADEIFGEMALAGDQTRTASIMAIEPTVLAVITHEYLAEKLNAADPMLRHLLRVTMARSRDSLRLAREGKTKSAQGEAPVRKASSKTVVDRDAALKRLRIEQDLERALEQNEFQLHFQPIMRLSDNSTAGFEALIRWFKPGVGKVPPNEFIWVAEESGLIVKMGHWIIRTACAAINRLEAVHRVLRPGAPPLFMTVNLSIRQFNDSQLFTVLSQAMQAEDVEPHRIKLEITESLVMNNMEAALALLQRCKQLGCKLAVDDFGTGYSSLSYLHKFPMDTLKLDRSFIKEIATDPGAMKIVRAVAGLAGDLGMDTVCEGTETLDQVNTCRQIGITYAQGFHFSPALPLTEAAAYLQSRAQARKSA